MYKGVKVYRDMRGLNFRDIRDSGCRDIRALGV